MNALQVLGQLALEGAGTDPLASLVAAGPAGAVVALLVTGLLITKRHADDLRANAETWRSAYELERQARTVEHDARVKAEAVAERSLEQGRVLIDVMNKIDAQLARGQV